MERSASRRVFWTWTSGIEAGSWAKPEPRVSSARLSGALSTLAAISPPGEEAGLTLEQIAVVTGTNREATKSRLRYAVAKLRAAIDEPGEQHE